MSGGKFVSLVWWLGEWVINHVLGVWGQGSSWGKDQSNTKREKGIVVIESNSGVLGKHTLYIYA